MIPKHQSIFEGLKEQIAAGKYRGGRRLPSEAELARRFGVSRPTAARALRDLQHLGIIRRHAGSGSYVNAGFDNSPKLSARTFGLLVPGLGNTEILDPICNEITRFAQSVGAVVLWGDSSAALTTDEGALALCHEYMDCKVDGVFFAPLETIANRSAVNKKISNLLHEAGIAVVLLDRDVLEFPARSHLDLIGIDNFSAGFVITKHLIDLGNRDFRFLARPDYPGTTDLRVAGCREAIARAGLAQTQPLTWIGEPEDVAFVRKMAAPTLPDAIICSNDQTAARLIQTLSNLQLRLPQDIRVVGFDDVKYATLLTVPLTTIHQPCRAIGEAAVRAMEERLRLPDRVPQQIFLPFKLMVRDSCGAKLSESRAVRGRRISKAGARKKLRSSVEIGEKK